MKQVKVVHVSAKELYQVQAEARARDFQQRAEDIKLGDVMLFRARGARLIKPSNISFND